MIVFFFKQKTAYEIRISDWSSDVCSSDLRVPAADAWRARPGAYAVHAGRASGRGAEGGARFDAGKRAGRNDAVGHQPEDRRSGQAARGQCRCEHQPSQLLFLHEGSTGGRSEEHTSELQSLMRISYAVVWWKKKTTQQD